VVCERGEFCISNDVKLFSMYDVKKAYCCQNSRQEVWGKFGSSKMYNPST
jgi:hypothetical protein